MCSVHLGQVLGCQFWADLSGFKAISNWGFWAASLRLHLLLAFGVLSSGLLAWPTKKPENATFSHICNQKPRINTEIQTKNTNNFLNSGDVVFLTETLKFFKGTKSGRQVPMRTIL